MTPKLQLMLGLELEMIWAMIYSFKHDHSELVFGVDWPLLLYYDGGLFLVRPVPKQPYSRICGGIFSVILS